MPPAPDSTCSTSLSSRTQMPMMSASRASSATVAAALAPAATRSAAACGATSNTTRGCLPPVQCIAIGLPMLPRPINPTLIQFSSPFETVNSTFERLEGLQVVARGKEALVHGQPVLTPFIHVRDPGLLSVDDPAAILFEDAVQVENALRAGRHQRVAVVLVQGAFGLTPLLDRQRSDHEIGEVAPRPALAHELPVEPYPFAVRPQIAVAQMAIAVDDAAGSGLRLLESIQRLVGPDETLRIIEHPLGNDLAKLGVRHVDLGVFPHDLELIGVDRSLHRGRQPFLLIELRAAPPGTVQTRQTLECARDLVDPGVWQALAKLSVLQRQIFHDDDALAHIRIPIRVVADGRRDVERIADEIVEASFEFADVDVAELARPVRLHAHVPRNSRSARGLVELERQPQFGRVRIDELDDFHAFDDDARVFVLQQAREPCGIDLLHGFGKPFGAVRIRAVGGGIGLIEHAVSWD